MQHPQQNSAPGAPDAPAAAVPMPDPVLAQVLGQLVAIQQAIAHQGQAISQQSQMAQLQNQATNARLDDMRGMVDRRFDDMQSHWDGRLNSHESRISRVETNERSTAMRSAATGGLTGAITSVLAELIKTAMRP